MSEQMEDTLSAYAMNQKEIVRVAGAFEPKAEDVQQAVYILRGIASILAPLHPDKRYLEALDYAVDLLANNF